MYFRGFIFGGGLIKRGLIFGRVYTRRVLLLKTSKIITVSIKYRYYRQKRSLYKTKLSLVSFRIKTI